jgi:hypothetical protein
MIAIVLIENAEDGFIWGAEITENKMTIYADILFKG